MTFLRSLILRRGTSHEVAIDLSVSQGRLLNRFAGTASEIELSEDFPSYREEDFDSSSSSGPILSQVQKSKPVIRGGEAPFRGLGGRSDSPVRATRRTRRAEELFKRSHMIFDGDVRVRVMDVDRFRLDELHQYFMFTLVRRFPAEKCVKLASRIAIFRDKQTQHSFESMSKDVGDLFGPIHGPELTALFSRCYSTIPVAFMLDYVRRFGKFSRRYIAMEVDKTLKPRLFDFVRYPGGVRPLPGIVTRPFALRSFAWLLPPCSAKRYIFQHLLSHSGDQGVLEKLRLEELESSRALLKKLTSGTEIDPQSPDGVRKSERLVAAWRKVERPHELVPLEASVLAKQPASADDVINELEGLDAQTQHSQQETEDPFVLQNTQVQAFKSPFHLDSLAVLKNEETSVEHSLDIYETPNESWWKTRKYSSGFFRHNKKAYRLSEGEGWKQVDDPRGELPDYQRPRALRAGRRKVAANFARMARQKARNSFINSALHRLVSRQE